MAQPSTFYGDVPRVSQLPMPGNPNAPIAEGADAIAKAAAGAASSIDNTNDQLRDAKLTSDRLAYQRQVQLASGDVAARLATMQGDLDTDLIAMREHAEPGATGYVEQVDQRVTKFRDDAHALLGGNPDLVEHFADNIASIGASARTGEVKWAMTQSAQKSVLDGETLQSSLQSNIRTKIAAGTFDDQVLANADKLDQAYVSKQPIPGTKAAEWLRERHDARLVTAVDAKIDVDPHTVLTDIDAGKYGELGDKTIEQLRDRARVAADRVDTKAKQAEGETLGVMRAEARNDIEDVNSGTHVDPARLQNWLTAATASTKPEDISLVHDLKIATAKNETTAKFDDATNDDRRAAMHEIEGHKGWEKNAQLVAAHDQLTTLIGRDNSAADKDPLSLYSRQTGQPIGDLNIHDPTAMRQRFIAADRAAERFNKSTPMVFTEAEAEQERQQYNSAPTAGKADFILSLGAYGSERARQMMFQIAPTKPELVRLAELSASSDPGVKAIVREAADGSAVPMKDGVTSAIKATAQRDYGPAFARMPGDRQEAILKTATWVYAHRAAASGHADQLSADLMHDSIAAALGGANGKGGLGRSNGAPVVLPMGASQDDFDRVMVMASPEEFRSAANGVPKWNGNRDMTLKDFRQLVPVQINDTGTQTLYAFRSRGGSGYVKNERGDDYVVDIRRLSAALAKRGTVRR
jgi:hypothetical protein